MRVVTLLNKNVELTRLSGIEIQREKQERTEAESAVEELRRRLDHQDERNKTLDDEISKLRLRAKDLRRGALFSRLYTTHSNVTYLCRLEKERDRAILSKHAKSLQHELESFEDLLRCKCEGVGPDRLLFRFWSVDRSDAEREFNFALDLGGDTYKGEVQIFI